MFEVRGKPPTSIRNYPAIGKRSKEAITWNYNPDFNLSIYFRPIGKEWYVELNISKNFRVGDARSALYLSMSKRHSNREEVARHLVHEMLPRMWVMFDMYCEMQVS